MTDLDKRREALEAKRQERRAAFEAKRSEQELTDLEAIYELEDAHGLSAVQKLRIPFVEGLPHVLAVRRPTAAEIKRFRDRTKATDKGRTPDRVRALDELAESCLLYPAPGSDDFEILKSDWPAVITQVGSAACDLATAEVEEEAKE